MVITSNNIVRYRLQSIDDIGLDEKAAEIVTKAAGLETKRHEDISTTIACCNSKKYRSR